MILIVGALTFFPALALGPLVEHLFDARRGALLIMATLKRPLFDPPIVRRAIHDSFVKLDPRHMLRNPVMFVVLVGSVLTTLILARDVAAGRGAIGFTLQIALWLWFTVLFAELRRSDGRGAVEGPSRHAAQVAHADDGEAAQ